MKKYFSSGISKQQWGLEREGAYHILVTSMLYSTSYNMYTTIDYITQRLKFSFD